MFRRPLLHRWRHARPGIRGARVFGAVVVVAVLAGGVAAERPDPPAVLTSAPTEDRAVAYDTVPTVDSASLHIAQAGYAVWAEPRSAIVTLATPGGQLYTSIPLSALAGRHDLPPGTAAQTTLKGSTLTTRMVDSGGHVLSQAVLHAGAGSFTVSFSCMLGPQSALTPSFFATGHRGVSMTGVEDGYTPDPRGPALSLAPQVSTVTRTPFAPAPFQVQLRTAPGWFGFGLVQVPSANTMRIGRDGVLTIDYPLVSAGTTPNFGAGPPQNGLVRFPDFVVTFAPDPSTGLRAYHDALAALHAITVASPPGSRPAWWSQPLVDTWGQQMAEKVHRGSPLFTAGWVRAFVADWRARYHVQQFTVIIDSRWQERIGDAMPDPIRFGGVAGMRALIDELHAQGLHVLLWWPIWAHHIDVIPLTAKQARLATPDRIIDPTAAGFATDMATTVGQLLGTGADGLGADGLKLDWQYNIPETLQNPGAAYGALALYRYMDAIHSAAHGLRHDALIDASSPAPQFAAVSDSVRLYDAWSAAEWDRRAAIVAAVSPDMLIDGDGWQADPASMVPHTVASTVYGTPAMYFGSTLVGGKAITALVSDQLGAVVNLSAMKGQGRAVPLAGGEWQYEVGGVVTAATFAHDHAVVVRAPGCTPTWKYMVASTVAGRLLVPTTGKHLVSAVDNLGKRVAATAVQHGVLLTVSAGGVYTLNFNGGC